MLVRFSCNIIFVHNFIEEKMEVGRVVLPSFVTKSVQQNPAQESTPKVDLVKLFDLLNNHLFNDELKGVAVRWSSNIKSHTAVSLRKKPSFGSLLSEYPEIFLSESLLSKCTRKQIIESLLVISIFIKSISIF